MTCCREKVCAWLQLKMSLKLVQPYKLFPSVLKYIFLIFSLLHANILKFSCVLEEACLVIFLTYKVDSEIFLR